VKQVCDFARKECSIVSIRAGSPILTPYPDFDTNIHGDLVSIFRVRIDACDRMWAFDTGINDVLESSEFVQPMKLVVIDLKTNKVPRTKSFPESLRSIKRLN